ncbi:hypothetical protein B0H19DRAFT_1157233 [Mycena capillaripes]|nr:hypothetical protein B0H19DRAFT_1157233 [Mycena capillaripes]
MFFRFYNQPGRELPLAEQAHLRNELLEVAKTGLDPVPDYQCLSSRPDALDDKLIVVAYTGTDRENEDSEMNPEKEGSPPRAAAFTSAMYLDVPGIDHTVLHTGLTIAVPSLQRTGILAQLFAQLFLNVMPLNPDGMWVTTLAAVLSSLVQSEKVLYKAYPSPQSPTQPTPQPLSEHLAIAHAIDERHRKKLLISPAAVWDEDSFVFRGSMDWEGAECFKKDVDDARFWHRNSSANGFFRGLMRPEMGDEVLLVGFIDANRLWEAVEEWQRQKARL